MSCQSASAANDLRYSMAAAAASHNRKSKKDHDDGTPMSGWDKLKADADADLKYFEHGSTSYRASLITIVSVLGVTTALFAVLFILSMKGVIPRR